MQGKDSVGIGPSWDLAPSRFLAVLQGFQHESDSVT
jgi:hypothetical protein